MGHTDYGSIRGEEPDKIASNALVLMVSSLKKPWYVPLAYFLTDKLNYDILYQLIIESIRMLCEVGAEVHAIVFDSAPKLLLSQICLDATSWDLMVHFPSLVSQEKIM